MKFTTLKILDVICKITEEIFDVYGDLTDLENNNKKNTSEFKDTLEKLCLLRDRELELYKYFMRDLKEACKAVEYLTRRSDKSLEAATSVTIDADEKEINRLRSLAFRSGKKVDLKLLEKVHDMRAVSMSEALKKEFKGANQIIDILFSGDPSREDYKKVIANL